MNIFLITEILKIFYYLKINFLNKFYQKAYLNKSWKKVIRVTGYFHKSQ